MSTEVLHTVQSEDCKSVRGMPAPHDVRRSLLAMLAFVVLWAVVELIAAPVFSNIPPFELVWGRYAVHLSLMVLVWGYRRNLSALWRTRRPTLQVGRSLLMLGMPASWIIGGERGVEMGTMLGIFWIAPLLVLALVPVVLREPVPVRYWIAGIAAFVGACMIVQARVPHSVSDVVFPTGMAVTFAVYVVLTRLLRTETVEANLFYTALGVFVSLSFYVPSIWVWPSLGDATAIVLVGVLGWLALLALDRSAASAPLSQAAIFLYVQVPITLLLLGFYGHADVRLSMAVGALLITGICLCIWAYPIGAGREGAS